ncbi:DinB/UmuC family translesion DNA polymerase [Terrihabitans sp. B22-R8]|uniref:DinB/UmuC family translesion DNA polymerase n=1 Tax=Terrihabitans sp. B22-R8 TaxID=3425128 RepID=UPI00403C72E8
MRAVTRSLSLDAPRSATAMIAEIAEELVLAALAAHPKERFITLLAVSVSHIPDRPTIQLELALGLPDEKRRTGTRQGAARWSVDRAMDKVRDRSVAMPWTTQPHRSTGRARSRKTSASSLKRNLVSLDERCKTRKSIDDQPSGSEGEPQVCE